MIKLINLSLGFLQKLKKLKYHFSKITKQTSVTIRIIIQFLFTLTRRVAFYKKP